MVRAVKIDPVTKRVISVALTPPLDEEGELAAGYILADDDIDNRKKLSDDGKTFEDYVPPQKDAFELFQEDRRNWLRLVKAVATDSVTPAMRAKCIELLRDFAEEFREK